MNDERLNFELGKARKLIVLFTLIFSLLYLILEISYIIISKGAYRVDFVIVVILIITSSAILLLEKRNCASVDDYEKQIIKDEMYEVNKSNYYNRVFLKAIYIIFLAYSFYVPFLFINGEIIWTGNRLISFFIFLTIYFTFTYMRFKGSYFNYDVIEESNKVFYHKIFKNILRVGLFFLIMAGVSIFVSIFICIVKNLSLLVFIVTFIITYLISFISIAAFYFFFSLFEKMNYKQEDKQGLSLSTIILLLIAVFFNIFVNILTSSYPYYLDNIYALFQDNYQNMSEFVMMLTDVTNYISSVTLLLSSIGFVYLYFDIRQVFIKNNDDKKIKVLYVFFVIMEVLIFLSTFRMYLNYEINSIFTTLIRQTTDIETLAVLMRIINKLSLGFLLLRNILCFVFAFLLTQDYKVFRKIVIFVFIMYLINVLSFGYFELLVTHDEEYFYVKIGYLIIMLITNFVVLIKYRKKNTITMEAL